jgi:hypothetical protein
MPENSDNTFMAVPHYQQFDQTLATTHTPHEILNPNKMNKSKSGQLIAIE